MERWFRNANLSLDEHVVALQVLEEMSLGLVMEGGQGRGRAAVCVAVYMGHTDREGLTVPCGEGL